jgi:tRNA-binding EMAP/Myf-like protein
VLVVHSGTVVGRVLNVQDHPDRQRIWLAQVDVGKHRQHLQIVFGGDYKVLPGQLVAVAPPGSEAFALNDTGRPRRKKMRTRRYGRQPSQGMFCSLDELGWCRGGPDEVAILRNLEPGACLDAIPSCRRADYVARPQCLQQLDEAATSTMSKLEEPTVRISATQISALQMIDRSPAAEHEAATVS